MQTLDSQTSASWQGNLTLTYGRKDEQTQLLSAYSRAPFKVQRPFYPELAPVCHSVIVHTAGGMVGGDRLSIDLTLGAHSHVLLTTSAAGKAYRAPEQPCTQAITIEAQAGSILEWLPQETILFEETQFEQTLKVQLAPGAIWVGMDLFRFGRTARGETFAAGSWRSHAEVWQNQHPLWIDRSYLTGQMRHHPSTLGDASVIGTFVIVGYDFDKDAIAQVKNQCLPLTPNDHQMGLSRLQSGLICRYRGTSTAQGRDLFLKIWEKLRPIYAGCGICIPRVWQI